jgi:hypothetical protein
VLLAARCSLLAACRSSQGVGTPNGAGGHSMGAPEEAPKGIRPIWIQMKNYAKYGLSKQPLEEGQQVDMNDCTPYVLLDRAEILADIEKYGFMVDFNDYKTDLQKFKAEVCGLCFAP